MTLLVGILCTDGAIVAADSAITFGVTPQQFTTCDIARKIDIVDNQIIVAGTGQVGLGQRFAGTVDTLWRNKGLVGGDHLATVTKVCAEVIKDFQQTAVSRGQFGALLAFPKKGEAHLCEFAVADLQPEMKTKRTWYVSLGSGQSLADPYLALVRNIFWKEGPPTVERGTFAAVWVMQHALRAAPGFIREPIDVAVLRKEGGDFRARLLTGDELQEHLTLAGDADRHFGSFFDAPAGADLSLPSLDDSKAGSAH